MWLTGFDVPCLHTMYIDKPLKNHSLMQAIARVNRIFKDKPAGLIVDYIGIADNLKKALSIYSGDIQRQAMIPIEEIIAKMQEKYDVVKAMFVGITYADWKKMQPAALAELFQNAINTIITSRESGRIDEEQKKQFLQESEALFRLWAFAMPQAEANRIRGDVVFFRAVKKAIRKLIVVEGAGGGSGGTMAEVGGVNAAIESAIRDLLDRSIAAESVVDVLGIKGKPERDISIFDDRFFEEVKNMHLKNLAIETLRKLLQDQLRLRTKSNLVRYSSLAELLEKIIEEYENNIINSSKVIERLIELAKEIQKTEEEGEQLGLSNDEMAFYDAIARGGKLVVKGEELKELVKELVRMIRRDLTIDWASREDVKSKIRANVRLLLLKNQFPQEESEQLIDLIYDQAISLYRDSIPAGSN